MSSDPHGDENTLIQTTAGPYDLGDGSTDPDWVITDYLILKLRTEDSPQGVVIFAFNANIPEEIR